MPELKIGRVGLDVALDASARGLSESSRDGARAVTFTGHLRAATLADTKALRNELVAQTGRLVAVTWTIDSDVDGFYILRTADITISATTRGFTGQGFFPFSVTLERVGSESETEIQSLITGTVVSNQHGLIASETAPFHAPAIGHLAYNSVSGTPTQRTRTGSDGALEWYDGVDDTVDPTWSVAPSSFYSGAVSVWVSSLLRSGVDAPNNINDFELSNTLVRVTPGTTTGVSNGRINVAWHDGTQWDTAVTFKIMYDAAGTPAVIPAWHYMSIIRNDPETCTLRLVRDAAPATSAHRHVLDVTLRRGSRFVSFYYTWTGATVSYDIIRDTNDAAAAFTPTGASSPVGVLDSVATDGNKWCVMTAQTHTARTTEGGIRVTGPKFDFCIGAEVGTPGTGDTAADLALQYFGWVSERDRAVRR